MADQFGNQGGTDNRSDYYTSNTGNTGGQTRGGPSASGGKQPPLRTNPNGRTQTTRSAGSADVRRNIPVSQNNARRDDARQRAAGQPNRAGGGETPNPRRSRPLAAGVQGAAAGAAGAGRKKKEKKKHKGIRRFFAVIFSLFALCVLVGGIVGGYVVRYMDKMVSGDVIIDLESQTANQNKTSIIYAYNNEGNPVEMARLHGRENRIWVGLEQMPKNLQNAYIALEDKRFLEHDGVDWIRTVFGVIKSKLKQGGSTITQQLIKNLTAQNDRTFSRKFNEIIQALNMEKSLAKEYGKTGAKDKIIEAYLNTLYLDGGCYGVETAAEYYFGKQVQDLNLAECACLAAITKAPRTYDPLVNFENNQARQHECLDYMLEQGLITEDECQAAKDYTLVFNVGENKVKVNTANADENDDTDEEEYESYYSDYVIQAVIDDLMSKYNYTYAVAERMVIYGGLSIYSAVDLDIQRTMEEVYYNRISFPSDEQIQSAITVMDYYGRLCGIVGQAGPKPGNRCLNMAANSPRQPGSSIKPLSVYAPAINEGLATYSTKVKNYGIMEVDGRIWPYNYGGDPGSPNSYKTVQQAIAPSLNTVAAQLLKKLSIETSLDYLTNHFHLSHLSERDEAYSPLATGGMTYGTTTLEMAAAYAVFGNQGRYYKPYAYYKVVNSAGDTILENDSSEYQQAIEPGTADVMNKLLQTVVTASDGTARKFPVSGQVLFAKTGTTTDNNDSWFCGGTPYYVGSVWVGYAESNRELKNIAGNSPSGKIFKEVFDRIHEGYEKKDFEMSEDSVRLTYCLSSGKRASSSCSDTAVGWYRADDIPGYCDGKDSSSDSKTTTTDPSATTTVKTTKTDETTKTTPSSSSSNAAETTKKPTTTKAPETSPPTETAAPPVDPEGDDR